MYSRLTTLSGALVEGMILRDADRAHIPEDPANGDWQAYQAWLKAGNAPGDAAAATPAPSSTRPA